MKIQIISGCMISGMSFFPRTKSGKNDVDTIIDVPLLDAKILIGNGQAKAAKTDAKITVKIKTESEDPALDDFFGEEDAE